MVSEAFLSIYTMGFVGEVFTDNVNCHLWSLDDVQVEGDFI